MKKYIASIFATAEVDIDTSMFEGTPIMPDTGMSLYNDFLNKKDLEYRREAKNRDGEIVMMTPNEYYRECSEYGFGHFVPVDKLKSHRRADSGSLDALKQRLENGKKFWLPVLNKADGSQEGLHRMMVLGDLYGWNSKKYPVLVVTAYDQVKEDRWNLIDEAYRFLEDDFDKMCGWGTNAVSDWKSPPPEDVEEKIREAIIVTAQDFNNDIDVDVEIKEVEGHQMVIVYLTRYKDYEFETLSNPYKEWLEDLFDVEGKYVNPTLDINNLDLDDLDDDLFI